QRVELSCINGRDADQDLRDGVGRQEPAARLVDLELQLFAARALEQAILGRGRGEPLLVFVVVAKLLANGAGDQPLDRRLAVDLHLDATTTATGNRQTVVDQFRDPARRLADQLAEFL